MRRQILAVLAASAAAFALAGAASQADARPSAGGWGAGRIGGGWAGARTRGSGYGHRNRLYGGAPVAAEISAPSDGYLAGSGGFLADSAGFLASSDRYPDDWGFGYGYGYPAYSFPVSYGYGPSATYVVRAYSRGYRAARVRPRAVTVHRSPPHWVSGRRAKP
jgi:hypothetical protein